jgi:hypothetical protein
MQVFINECSIHEQYENDHDFVESVKSFVKSIKYISELKHDKEIFKSDLFFYSKGLKDTHFETSLKKNKSINSLFNENFKLINPKSWDNDLTHKHEDSYIYNNVEYTTTSIAELSERKIIDNLIKGFLLNFTQSIFADKPHIEVLKNNLQPPVIIDCNYDSISIYNWLVENNFIIPSQIYDVTSKFPPTDKQTILNNSALFQLTTFQKNKGRNVYRKIGTNQLWCVDSLHYGNYAHMEIFNEVDCKHMGTSLYNQDNIDTSRAKSKRVIYL